MCPLPLPVPDTLLLEDFNLSHAKQDPSGWSAGVLKDEQNMIKPLYGHVLENFLIQQVECLTHNQGNTLDIVFTN